MRAALILEASKSDMCVTGDEDVLREIIRASQVRWSDVREGVMHGWNRDSQKGIFWLQPPPPPKKAERVPREKIPDQVPIGAAKEKSKGALSVNIDKCAVRVTGEERSSTPETKTEVKEARRPKDIRDATIEERFETFWSIYPNLSGRKPAFDAFKAKKLTNEELQSVISDVKLRSFTRKWTRQGGEFIPHASTYLNNTAWTEPLLLTDSELAASTLPAKERKVFFDRSLREIETWTGTQRVMGLIPSIADLAAHIGVPVLPSNVVNADLVDSRFSRENVIDAEATVASNPAGSNLATVPTKATPKSPKPSAFKVELDDALSNFDEDHRQRVLSKPEAKQREWLKLWKATNSNNQQKTATKPEFLMENTPKKASSKATPSSQRSALPVDVVDVSKKPGDGDVWF
jgi:hypothetical protein